MIKNIFLAFLVIVMLAECSKKDAASAAQKSLNSLGVGASSADFLSTSKYQSINLEIQYMPGYAPDAAALGNLTTFLNSLLNKPGGINITQKQIPSTGNTSLTQAQVYEIEKSNRTVFTTGTAIGVYFLFTDAAYTDPKILGISYKNTSMALFGKTVHDNAGGIRQPSLTDAETLVEEHEFGHILGLVNLGSPMQVNHEDASHKNHCNNANCLMYYAAQVNLMSGIISSVPPLDANCRNDLKANGGK
ncbi:MAG: hypothetical protein ABIT07_12555 [Ferruginibacter sp.]